MASDLRPAPRTNPGPPRPPRGPDGLDGGANQESYATRHSAPALRELPLSTIRPNPNNPRRTFDEDDLRALGTSIRQSGLVQPIVVRPGPGPAPNWILIAGERRYRAALLVGLTTLPALIRSVKSEAHALQLTLLENLQRRDLSAVEEARGYQRLVDLGWKHAEIAHALQRAPATVANALRLLKLPREVQRLIEDGLLTPAHGRALAGYTSAGPPEHAAGLITRLAEHAVREHATSKDVESARFHQARSLDAQGVTRLIKHPTRPILFDTAVCQSCPFHAYRNGVCLYPPHFDQLNAGAATIPAGRHHAIAADVPEAGSHHPVAATAPPGAIVTLPDVAVPCHDRAGNIAERIRATLTVEAPQDLTQRELAALAYLVLRDLGESPHATPALTTAAEAHGVPASFVEAQPCATGRRQLILRLLPTFRTWTPAGLVRFLLHAAAAHEIYCHASGSSPDTPLASYLLGHDPPHPDQPPPQAPAAAPPD